MRHQSHPVIRTINMTKTIGMYSRHSVDTPNGERALGPTSTPTPAILPARSMIFLSPIFDPFF